MIYEAGSTFYVYLSTFHIDFVSEDSRSIQEMSTFEISGHREMSGVAWSGNRIYVLCEKPKKVRVFHDTEPFEEEEGFEIDGMGDQLDMVVSRTGNRLIIISDWDRDFLWKIKVPDKIPIREKIDGHPGKLWISPTDKLLLVVNRGTSRDINLDIYSVRDDSWERSVPVTKKVTSIWHAVETSKKTFIISHANRTSPQQWLVSELSADGQNFIHTFDPQRSVKLHI